MSETNAITVIALSVLPIAGYAEKKTPTVFHSFRQVLDPRLGIHIVFHPLNIVCEDGFWVRAPAVDPVFGEVRSEHEDHKSMQRCGTCLTGADSTTVNSCGLCTVQYLCKTTKTRGLWISSGSCISVLPYVIPVTTWAAKMDWQSPEFGFPVQGMRSVAFYGVATQRVL